MQGRPVLQQQSPLLCQTPPSLSSIAPACKRLHPSHRPILKLFQPFQLLAARQKTARGPNAPRKQAPLAAQHAATFKTDEAILSADEAVPAAETPLPATTAARCLPPVAQYLDFELVWLDHRQQLSMSKGAAERVLAAVRAGRMPCDAALLRGRAEALLRLEGRRVAQASGELNARRLMNEHPDALCYDASLVEAWVRRMPLLLPHLDPTLLLLATLGELRRTMELVAVQYGELDLAYRSVLGTQLPGPLFSHLLEYGLGTGGDVDAPQVDSAAQPADGQGESSSSANGGHQHASTIATTPQNSAAQQLDASAVVAQLQALVHVLGPELCHVALRNTPAIVGLPARELSEQLLALQRVLHVGHMQVLLAAEEHGAALLLPAAQMARRRAVLLRCLERWVRLDESRAQTLLRRAPSVLTWDWDGAALAAQWTKGQHLAHRRRRWAVELAAAPPALVVSLLGAPPEALQRLQYLGDSGDMPAVGLRRALGIRDIDFVQACPGYRRWRLQHDSAAVRAKMPEARGADQGRAKGWGRHAAAWAQAGQKAARGTAGTSQPPQAAGPRRSRLVRLEDLD